MTKYLSFDGVDDEINFGDFTGTFVSNPALSGQMTVEFWLNMKSGYYILSGGGQTSSTGITVSYGNGSPLFWLKTATKHWRVTPTITLNTPAFWSMVWDGTKLEIFKNGVSVGSDSAPATVSVSISSQPSLVVGKPNHTTGFKGRFDFDELRIWNIARTQSDITADMDSQLAGTETGLYHYWKMDEGSGTTVYDSVNSKNGTITGAIYQDGGVLGGGDAGTDGEITLGLTQQIYSDSSVNLSLTQKIYADISANLDLIQTIYRDAESLLGLNQMIYKDSEAVLNFNQAIYQESEKSLNLRQEIYTEAESILNLIQEFYEDSQTYITLQLIQQIYKDNSSDLPLTQVIYQDREINLPLRQEMYEEKETNVSLTQTIYNDDSSVLNLSQTIYRDSFSAMNLAQQMYSEGEIALPLLIEIRDDLIQYNEVIRLILNITRKQSEIILLSRKQVATIDVTQRIQSELKL